MQKMPTKSLIHELINSPFDILDLQMMGSQHIYMMPW